MEQDKIKLRCNHAKRFPNLPVWDDDPCYYKLKILESMSAVKVLYMEDGLLEEGFS